MFGPLQSLSRSSSLRLMARDGASLPPPFRFFARDSYFDMAQINLKTLQAPIAALTVAGTLFLCELSDERVRTSDVRHSFHRTRRE